MSFGKGILPEKKKKDRIPREKTDRDGGVRGQAVQMHRKSCHSVFKISFLLELEVHILTTSDNFTT